MKILTILAGLILVFVFVWERVDIVRVGYQVERSKTQKLVLERERDQLQVRFSSVTAPERIAKLATERLGMVQPQQGQVITVHVRPEGVPASPVLPNEVRVARNDSPRRLSE
jgi:cell division protein FtsL